MSDAAARLNPQSAYTPVCSSSAHGWDRYSVPLRECGAGNHTGGRAPGPARQQLHSNSALRPFDFDLPPSLTSQLSVPGMVVGRRGQPQPWVTSHHGCVTASGMTCTTKCFYKPPQPSLATPWPQVCRVGEWGGRTGEEVSDRPLARAPGEVSVGPRSHAAPSPSGAAQADHSAAAPRRPSMQQCPHTCRSCGTADAAIMLTPRKHDAPTITSPS